MSIRQTDRINPFQFLPERIRHSGTLSFAQDSDILRPSILLKARQNCSFFFLHPLCAHQDTSCLFELKITQFSGIGILLDIPFHSSHFLQVLKQVTCPSSIYWLTFFWHLSQGFIPLSLLVTKDDYALNSASIICFLASIRPCITWSLDISLAVFPLLAGIVNISSSTAVCFSFSSNSIFINLLKYDE